MHFCFWKDSGEQSDGLFITNSGCMEWIPRISDGIRLVTCLRLEVGIPQLSLRIKFPQVGAVGDVVIGKHIPEVQNQSFGVVLP